VSLLRDRAFRLLWTGQTVSILGDQITILALPLTAVLVLDAGAGAMGILFAAAWAPHLVLSLPVGVWIDRMRRRRAVIVVTDLARGLALASIPVAYAFDVLTIGQLVAVALVLGALTVVFDVALGIVVPLVVPRERYAEGQAAFSMSRSAASIAGPALAGGLVQALTAPVALVVDSLSFVFSALTASRVPVEESPPAQQRNGLRADLRAGLAFVLGHPLLRASTGCTATLNFFNFAFNAVVVLYFARVLGLSAGVIGLVFSAGAVGALLGAAIAPRVGKRLGVGRTIVLGAVLFPAPLLLFPLAMGSEPVVVAVLIVGEALASIGVMLFDVNNNSLIVLSTPPALRGRQFGAMRTIVYGVRPLGALLGGALGAWIGLRPTLWLTGTAALLGVVWLVASPLRDVRELPADVAQPA
jgi:MFS family permease